MNYLLLFLVSLLPGFTDSGVPEFKGGQKGLSSFILRSLIYPEYSKQNCLQGTVNVSFKLDRKGRIFSSRVEKGYGIDLDVEALRIIRLTSGRWTVPSGFDTTQALTIPINFSLSEYNCNQRPAEEKKEAIAAYKARIDLTNAITNFYSKRSAGNYDPADEMEIISLKEQLGYNEKFIDRVLRQAQLKLKQGDKQGACEDLVFIRNLGSDRADKLIETSCR